MSEAAIERLRSNPQGRLCRLLHAGLERLKDLSPGCEDASLHPWPAGVDGLICSFEERSGDVSTAQGVHERHLIWEGLAQVLLSAGSPVALAPALAPVSDPAFHCADQQRRRVTRRQSKEPVSLS